MLKKTIPFLLSAGDRVLPLTRHTPYFAQRLAMQRGLNKVFAEALEDGLFDILDDRWVQLRIHDLGLQWCITKSPRSNQLLVARQAPVEVTIAGNWREFLLLASRQEDPDTLFFRRRLQIDGDTELGLAVKNLIDSLDPESLPKWLWHAVEAFGQSAAAQQQAQILSGEPRATAG
ncbi:ubiquinone anaerobic biosynthesis accessory factor UbiT [Thiopseudomonas denitrificans]|uniref:Ubiquinone biosynthesis accessory factor UbiT n=1 Tax=Thiopseudomonas denitrificans TaxID=1501432 RepID=A0A4R6U2K7_9GAMM|nr:SCP2 sterol-binding domain-containing protein [Thiopseudomonas denitrificans]TDQ40211.1 putative lipid carrier protein YhbT [Thiopseudomonas denitrificans]